MPRNHQETDDDDYDDHLDKWVNPHNPADRTDYVRLQAKDFLNDPEYTQMFIVRLLAGKVPPDLEAFIWEVGSHEVLDHPDYIASVKRRMDTGTMHPVVELAIWYAAYGRPETHGDSRRNGPDARRYMGFLAEDLEKRRKAKQNQATTSDAPSDG